MSEKPMVTPGRTTKIARRRRAVLARSRGSTRVSILAAVLLAPAFLVPQARAAAPNDPAGPGPVTGPIVVSAASSLTEAFEELAAEFERLHPGVRVELNLGGSSTLATQVLNGAPVDVFASADSLQMTRVADAGLVSAVPRVFAANVLVAITPAGSSLTDLADLAAPGVRLVLAGPEVPAGHYAREWLGALEPIFGVGFAAKVLANLVSEETNVRQVAAKVELGEADAAIVYATDARVLAGVRVLSTAGLPEMRTEYLLAALATADAARSALAEEFVALVLSPQGEAALTARGFVAP